MKVCFYAINGHGLGHLSRCYAVAKKLEVLLEMLSLEADIQFLTTSEADYLVSGFPVFKIPSRAGFRGRKAAASRYAANGKMMVSSMLSHFSPDLLVMDTVAQGCFQEFSFVRDFARSRVLIDRHKKSEYGGSRIHQAHLPLFDKIIVPDDEECSQDYTYDYELQTRVKFVGKVHSYERSAALSREKVREYFHVEEGQKLVYLSAGGGGDLEAEEQITKLLSVLLDFGVKVVLGYGALSKSNKVYGLANVVALTEFGVSRYFNGLDLAISAAGYNTYEELMAAKVNSLFFIQAKGMDMQERRVAQGLEAGWHGVLDLDLSREGLMKVIKRGLDTGVSDDLKNRDYAMGGCVAAHELLMTGLKKEMNNVEMKLSGAMALWVLKSYSLGYWTTCSVSDCYKLWKVWVVEREGLDAWQERCIAAVSEKRLDDCELKQLGADLQKIAKFREESNRAGLMWREQVKEIKKLAKVRADLFTGDDGLEEDLLTK